MYFLCLLHSQLSKKALFYDRGVFGKRGVVDIFQTIVCGGLVELVCALVLEVFEGVVFWERVMRRASIRHLHLHVWRQAGVISEFVAREWWRPLSHLLLWKQMIR